MPLRTRDLYEKPGYGFDFGDLVRFNLCRGLVVKVAEAFRPLKFKYVGKSDNPDANRSITGKIEGYKPHLGGDLEIAGTTKDGYTFSLKLSQCRDLKVIEDDSAER